MRHVLIGLCALTLVGPAAAQEKIAAPQPAPAVTFVPATQDRPGLFARVFTRSRATTPGYPIMTPATTTGTATTAMTPLYDRRGRLVGWQQLAVSPAPATVAKATPAETSQPAPAAKTETKPAQVSTPPSGQIIQATYTEPATQPRRGLLSRIFRR
jgi:hypothetical protein